jgi:hypothetical protein
VVGVLAVVALFALNFDAYRVFGDGVNYDSFTPRLFGTLEAEPRTTSAPD